jgi:FkbM family methyltransferase
LPFADIVDPSNQASCPFVFCIEAIRSNYEALIQNIKLNQRQSSIAAIGKAVGEQEKTVGIQVEGNLRDGEGTGTANILAEGSDYPCERIPLTITTLDQLMESGEIPKRCSLIKIDVDGYDLFVLQGAKQMLAFSRPIVFGEFNSHCLAWHGRHCPNKTQSQCRRIIATWISNGAIYEDGYHDRSMTGVSSGFLCAEQTRQNDHQETLKMDEWPHLIIERRRTHDRVVLLVGANGEPYGDECRKVRPAGEGWQIVGTEHDHKTDWRRVLVHWWPDEAPRPVPTELANKAIDCALAMIRAEARGETGQSEKPFSY